MGTVIRVDKTQGDARLFLESPVDLLRGVEIGASIACSGCCLTVVDRAVQEFAADVSAETLLKTMIGQWKPGTRVNLERALCAGDELGGHLVSGHVDSLAKIESITVEGDSHRLKISVPLPLSRYIASKGSVALDGISLTVNEVEGSVFGVNIIPHTWIHTTLGERKPGDFLHLEVDILARYVARMMDSLRETTA